MQFELEVPACPNYVTVKGPFVLASSPITERPKVDIADLTDAQLSKLADEWKLALLQRAAMRRSERSGQTIVRALAQK
jgi:hypothetical protein